MNDLSKILAELGVGDNEKTASAKAETPVSRATKIAQKVSDKRRKKEKAAQILKSSADKKVGKNNEEEKLAAIKQAMADLGMEEPEGMDLETAEELKALLEEKINDGSITEEEMNMYNHLFGGEETGGEKISEKIASMSEEEIDKIAQQIGWEYLEKISQEEESMNKQAALAQAHDIFVKQAQAEDIAILDQRVQNDPLAMNIIKAASMDQKALNELLNCGAEALAKFAYEQEIELATPALSNESSTGSEVYEQMDEKSTNPEPAAYMGDDQMAANVHPKITEENNQEKVSHLIDSIYARQFLANLAGAQDPRSFR